MDVFVAVLVGLLGLIIVTVTMVSAAQTFVVPRGTPMLITRWTFLGMQAIFHLLTGRAHGYRSRDRVMAMFGPFSLLALPLVWLALVVVGFAAIYWSLGVHPWQDALLASGSSLFTLGFRGPTGVLTGVIEMVEAAFGLGLVALLISYLPTIYATYSRRELLVTALETEAGDPPSAAELLDRLLRIKGLPLLETYWADWTKWFNEIEETHATTPMLVFFRSPSPDRSWVTAAGAVLDSAALVVSTFDPEEHIGHCNAEICLRAGYLALRRTGDYFAMPYKANAQPGDGIAVSRQEYDEVCDRLVDAGAKLRDDRDEAWRDFIGWRVTYESTLLRFASLCMAPTAPWSSDRPIEFHRLPITRHRDHRLIRDRRESGAR
ncbi:hypothetical protein [Planosporangium flavigriseum]|uniref:Two pore domain potassium channel family protein n=1 Tax=Planosporangium flavigriseum TaxID=373681 RepID=A0A8J3PQK8_9ACTN|nr:hypothetical protein [Planosporangium flavigriseum]GIG76211.1 hypothetical protein Pfl04_46150 [Planosporangium flavigriseum]